MELSKYNGCGNDFLLLAYTDEQDYSQLALELCSKKRFDTDGLIAVKTAPYEMVYYNKDGSRAPMCGNGIRCFANYLYDHQFVVAEPFTVQTLAGPIDVNIGTTAPFYCTAKMGRPDWNPQRIAVDQKGSVINQPLQLADETVLVTSFFMGTIHTVLFVEDAVAEVKKKRGERICHHPLFNEQTNVNFVQVINENELLVRTYERGVGWTLACGTGCCAAFVAARAAGLVGLSVIVHLEQGDLEIAGTEEIHMAGPAVREWTKEWEANSYA